ncbi:MAG: leucine--tRNA ligase [Chitinophagaceae bacterium]|nr:leucine--tRNA ligase [Chitinophagaceae bacterium]
MQYSFEEIEKKWQQHWIAKKTYEVAVDENKPKCYVLDMFPYPSGAGLHVGHPLGYIASDIYSRFKRLKGFNVLHPMGFDSFGLPAEQYAIETGQHPAKTTEINIARYKEQLGKIGFCFDWSKEVQTAKPEYYKWTQWIFLQLFNSWYNKKLNKTDSIANLVSILNEQGNKELGQEPVFSAVEWKSFDAKKQADILMSFRLAFRAESLVNWCEALGTVLANDEVVNGVSERGSHPVERKKMSQWFLRITAFAERLLAGLNDVDFPESLCDMQRNWIGKSKGASIDFEIENSTEKIKVFTTRPDTIFGVSFLVLAPEHELVNKITSESQKNDIATYVKTTSGKSERERLSETKNVSGCPTGAFAFHPITKEKLPIWIADYVLAGYGTGAIMAVPSGDERDAEFAKKYDLPIPSIFENLDSKETVYTEKNFTLCNSDFLNDMNYEKASETILNFIETNHLGEAKINYRMRDAGFSRQRYWGEPFPIIYDENGIASELKDLPVELPYLEKYSAGPNGKGPLANATDWVNYSADEKNYSRETDTMPGYAGSSWYYLRYMDAQNETEFCARKNSDYWNQVDVYVGGAEHAVGHLLYSRMWCKALYDLGYIGFEEPYKKIINQGMIGGSSRFLYRVKGEKKLVSFGLKNNFEVDEIHVDVNCCNGNELDIEKLKAWRNEFEDFDFELENEKYICGEAFEKMSKSKYNVVNPDDIVAEYGADTFRMYEMFLGPIEMSKPWNTQGIEGVHRFLKKFWRLFYNEEKLIVTETEASKEALKALHKCIEKIDYDCTHFSFNTAVSQFMITTNELTQLNCHEKSILEPLLILLAPFAPHICEELWEKIGNSTSVLDAQFPVLDKSYLVQDSFTYPVAINGKTRTTLDFSIEMEAAEIEKMVLENDIVLKWTEGKTPKKFIFVKGKMINVVV